MMLRILRSALRPPAPMGPPDIGPDRRVYAVGDVHGRLDLLRDIIDRIAADDWARGPIGSTDLILLGDYIDRGPQSAQVIDFIIRLQRWWPNLQCLMGNHEEVFSLAARGDESALRFLTRIGGRETILSYGATEEDLERMTLGELRDWLTAHVPDEHLDFIDSLEEKVVFGDYAFVHAARTFRSTNRTAKICAGSGMISSTMLIGTIISSSMDTASVKKCRTAATASASTPAPMQAGA
jgi:serine/threonine protein phosphatase 1